MIPVEVDEMYHETRCGHKCEIPAEGGGEVELPRCPFCGCNARWMVSTDAPEPEYNQFVECFGCGASTAYCKTKGEAVDAWSRRASGLLSEEMPRRWCAVHQRQEFKYESLEHELASTRTSQPAQPAGELGDEKLDDTGLVSTMDAEVLAAAREWAKEMRTRSNLNLPESYWLPRIRDYAYGYNNAARVARNLPPHYPQLFTSTPDAAQPSPAPADEEVTRKIYEDARDLVECRPSHQQNVELDCFTCEDLEEKAIIKAFAAALAEAHRAQGTPTTEARASLTDAEVDAILEEHKDNPVDESQLERVRTMFNQKLGEQVVEDFIRSLPWSDSATEDEKTLVAGNIRGFAGYLRAQPTPTDEVKQRARVAGADLARQIGRQDYAAAFAEIIERHFTTDVEREEKSST